ncbi:MAG: NnrS family protein [Bacterioplanes sp.]|nr:NnrS family protein [Bacterioplanes sp.]
MNNVTPPMWFSSPLWRQAFRPMFLFGASFSVLAMALWLSVLMGWFVWQPVGGPFFWHSHEMVFGFAGAIVVGFLLTAVQNWTGVRATQGGALVLLTALWLVARVLMMVAPAWPWWLIAAIDVAFFVLAAWFFARILWAVKQQRNAFFVLILLLWAGMNVLHHFGLARHNIAMQQWALYSAVWLITLVMAIVGGRIIPMFTANGTLTPKVTAKLWLDRASLASLWLLAALQLTALNTHLPSMVLVLLHGVAALLIGWRWVRWRIWITWRTPLLWSLHCAYGFIPLALLAFAAHYAGLAVSASLALHALTVGAMGLLILAMLARISLGHSGRPLIPHPIMAWAFAALLLAAISRTVMVGVFPQWTVFGWWVAALLWCLGYGLYVGVYARILLTPRADGRDG